MFLFRSVFFEDASNNRGIDKEGKERGLFRAKQQKSALISVKKYVMQDFFLFSLKNLAPKSELRGFIF
jgi:hypothetical protein